MPTRIIKVYGYSTGANLSFTFNGIEVFNGTIASTGDENNLQELFTFDLDTTVNGNVPGIVRVTEGFVCPVYMKANNMIKVHDGFTDSDGVVVEAVTVQESADIFVNMSSSSNVSTVNRIINGVEQITDMELPGAMHNPVNAGENFVADWAINNDQDFYKDTYEIF